MLASGRPSLGGKIEMRVQQDGEDQLIYQFDTIAEAVEIMVFIQEFFPGARYLIQPLTQ